MRAHCAAVPTKVVLPIFSPENEGADGESTWTEGFELESDQKSATNARGCAW